MCITCALNSLINETEMSDLDQSRCTVYETCLKSLCQSILYLDLGNCIQSAQTNPIHFQVK